MNIWRWPMLAGFCAALTACPHPNSNAPVKSLNDAKQSCLQRMRTNLKKDAFHFAKVEGVPAFGDVDAVNAHIDSLGIFDPTYQLNRDSSTSKTTSLEMMFESKNRDFSVDDRLSQADSDSVFFFSLTVRTDEMTSPNVERQIEENYDVTQNCELQLNTLSLTTTTVNGDDVQLHVITHHMDGRAGSHTEDQKSFHVPAGGHLVNSLETAGIKTLSDFRDYLDKHKGQTLYLTADSLGLTPIEIQFHDPVVETNPYSKRSQKFEVLDLSFTLPGGGNVTERLKQASEKEGYLEILGTHSQTWTVLEPDWDRASFDSANNEGIHTVEIESGVNTSNVVGAITTTRKLDDPDLSEYWTILDQKDLTNDPKGWVWQATMKPRIWAAYEPLDSAPLDSEVDRSGPDAPYLSESDYVHFKIPSLQPLLAQLEPYRQSNRMQMAQAILNVVQNTIKYDYNSLTNSGIYPLSTEDILARKEGVCQHFAVLFASLARAVGLPTKVIVGFVSGGKGTFGGHAWNEIETSPGVWRPVEPQGNLEFDSYSYIPLGNAYMLERKDLSKQVYENNEALVMTQFDLHLRPGP